MIKPFDAKQLLEKIEQIFEKKANDLIKSTPPQKQETGSGTPDADPIQADTNAQTLTQSSEKKLGEI